MSLALALAWIGVGSQAILNKAKEIRQQSEQSTGAEPAAAVAADAGAAGRLLFNLDVNIGGEHGTVPMAVHDGAVPKDVAKAFAAKYALPDTAVTQLTNAIIDHAKKNGLVK